MYKRNTGKLEERCFKNNWLLPCLWIRLAINEKFIYAWENVFHSRLTYTFIKFPSRGEVRSGSDIYAPWLRDLFCATGLRRERVNTEINCFQWSSVYLTRCLCDSHYFSHRGGNLHSCICGRSPTMTHFKHEQNDLLLQLLNVRSAANFAHNFGPFLRRRHFCVRSPSKLNRPIIFKFAFPLHSTVKHESYHYLMI